MAAEKTTKSKSATVRNKLVDMSYTRVATGTATKQLSGFVMFLREQSVVGLAIGIVIGSQVQAIAKSLVSDFINPLIALLMPGGGNLSQKSFLIHRTGRPPQEFMWGDFVSNLIAFVMIVAVIYFVIKGLKLDKLDKKKEA
jgi:large conductance mechanosensitive channel